MGYIALPASSGVHLGPVKAYGVTSTAVRVFAEGKVLGISGVPENSDSSSFDATAFLGINFKIFFVGVDIQYDSGLVNVINNFKNN